MKISIIIATINRQKDLKKLLHSLKKQQCKAYEIIIVEQGNYIETKKIADSILKKNYKVIFSNIASLVRARNIGLQHSRLDSDIILFLDDDVILSQDYLCQLQQIAKKYKNTYAFAGVFKSGKENSFIKKFIGTLFCISKLNEKRNVVLRSSHNLMRANDSKEAIFVEWISGLNMAYRYEIFKKYKMRFYEGFTKYSLGEDVFFSYQVFQKFGEKSILINPLMKLEHTESQVGRLYREELIKMRIIYKYILWYKLIKNYKRFSFLCFILSELILVIYYIFLSKNKMSAVTVSMQTYLYLIKNRRKIINETTDYNKFIFS